MKISVVLSGHRGKINQTEIDQTQANLNSELGKTATIELRSLPVGRWEIRVGDNNGGLEKREREEIIGQIGTPIIKLYRDKFKELPPVRWDNVSSKRESVKGPTVDSTNVGSLVASGMRKWLKHADENPDAHIDELSKQFEPIESKPDFALGDIVFHGNLYEEISMAVGLSTTQLHRYNEWGLDALASASHCIFNFQGEPGTGKTVTAFAIAANLNKKIINPPANFQRNGRCTLNADKCFLVNRA